MSSNKEQKRQEKILRKQQKTERKNREKNAKLKFKLKPAFKLKNEKLYRRINFSFSALFLSVSVLVLTAVMLISVFVPMGITKKNFKEENLSYITEIISQKSEIMRTPKDARISYIYSRLGKSFDKNREISVQLSDGNRTYADNTCFEEIFSPAKDRHITQADGLKVEKFSYQKERYYWTEYRISLDDYAITLRSFENIEDNYIYVITICIVTASALVLVVIIIVSSGWFVSRRALAPLYKVAEAVKSITEENLAKSINVEENTKDAEVDNLIIELNHMLNRLNSAFEHQKRFVSDVSHELRIPLTIIQGYIDIIQSWGKDDRDMLNESITAIEEEVQGINNLIEKFLLLQNLASGNMKLNRELTDINQMLKKTAQETRLLTEKHSIIQELDENLPFIMTDKILVNQAIRALIENSIKYTPEGGSICLSSKSSKHYVHISVSDTGCGIEQEQIAKVTERFYRVDCARTKKTGGSGLGLSIVKATVEALGGTMMIKSVLNKGSKITLSLPKITG